MLHTVVFDMIQSVNLSCNWLHSPAGAHNNINANWLVIMRLFTGVV